MSWLLVQFWGVRGDSILGASKALVLNRCTDALILFAVSLSYNGSYSSCSSGASYHLLCDHSGMSALLYYQMIATKAVSLGNHV